MPSVSNFINTNKKPIYYGFILAASLLLLKWMELRFHIISNAFEIYVGLIAIVFTALGIWLAKKLTKPKIQTVIIERENTVEKDLNFIINQKAIEVFNLSKRELEVLNLMAEGLSNQEIADRLFVSLNTIKTHNSKLFEKMEVKRRTQAVEIAKRVQIIK
ncbi:LuxR C-terminal-related transcriptional regulator [Pedobacter aquatilis]|uniref:response regulator transcription factor n=1 Tax=Pedobacter aquatilis TaxID=351343 RepID=UPI0025B3EE9C|nr:LuxR C-terminal-related transcriptional regulator [Pedobacter aquatilis]MDN3586307.1 LuxR C-terminal-related transcriptional regulator [Pedobacter aquatilis]